MSIEQARAEARNAARDEAARNTATLLRLADELATAVEDAGPAPPHWRHLLGGCGAVNHAPDGAWRPCSACGEVCDHPDEARTVGGAHVLPPPGVHLVIGPPRFR